MCITITFECINQFLRLGKCVHSFTLQTPTVFDTDPKNMGMGGKNVRCLNFEKITKVHLGIKLKEISTKYECSVNFLNFKCSTENN